MHFFIHFPDGGHFAQFLLSYHDWCCIDMNVPVSGVFTWSHTGKDWGVVLLGHVVDLALVFLNNFHLIYVEVEQEQLTKVGQKLETWLS